MRKAKPRKDKPGPFRGYVRGGEVEAVLAPGACALSCFVVDVSEPEGSILWIRTPIGTVHVVRETEVRRRFLVFPPRKRVTKLH